MFFIARMNMQQVSQLTLFCFIEIIFNERMMVPLKGFIFKLPYKNCVMILSAFHLQIILHSKNNLKIFCLMFKMILPTNRKMQSTRLPVGVATNTTKGIVSHLVHKTAQQRFCTDV